MAEAGVAEAGMEEAGVEEIIPPTTRASETRSKEPSREGFIVFLLPWLKRGSRMVQSGDLNSQPSAHQIDEVIVVEPLFLGFAQ